MKPYEDPSVLFEQIINIRGQFSKVKVNDSELFAVIMQAVPRSYQHIVSSARMQRGSALTVTELQNYLVDHY